jgi:phosphoserine aminotransferase
MKQTKENLCKLLKIPTGYSIWFTSGGVHLQFAGIPMNFGGKEPKNVVANYTTTGYFSKLAFTEAKKIVDARSIVDMQKDSNGLFTLPQ